MPELINANGLRLDLACGGYKEKGYLGVDKFRTPETDQIVDLQVYPWPWEDESITAVRCSHYFEHLDGAQRMQFMEELYRILIPAGKAIMITPHWSSTRAYMDPTHKWPPVCEYSYAYFDRNWREKERLHHYLPITCDFEYVSEFMVYDKKDLMDMLTKRFGPDSFHNLLNVVDDIKTTLTKRGRLCHA